MGTELSYKDSGVDIDAGNALVERIKPAVARTRRPEVLAGLGGFGALFALKPHAYREPVLVSGTDGVGTKLKLAQQLNAHDTIGIDLVAMCVNDILVQGAEPLFFLDYYACGALDVASATRVIEGIARGCELAGCALIGGETAEMPGMYEPGSYDLAGFAVGVVERERLIDGSAVRVGDVLLGLASSGPHSNGYSLIRKVLERSGADLAAPLAGRPLGEHLLAPTEIYVKAVLRVLRETDLHALAHITGGGLTENIVRVIPMALAIEIDRHSWPRPAIFGWLASEGQIADDEMLRVFNCGVGMVVAVAAAHATRVAELFATLGHRCWPIGRVTAHSDGPRVVYR